MRSCSYIDLGATLFVPASHRNLSSIVSGEKYQDLKSLVIDFEDGLDRSEYAVGVKGLQEALSVIKSSSPYIFIRPKNPEMLEEFLTFKGIEGVDGFVFPKFGLQNAREYLDVATRNNLMFMPSIEGAEVFEYGQLLKLRDILLEHKKSVILVRFGLEDILKQLAMRRECDESFFDTAVGSYTLGRFIATMKGSGFAVSGGVYPCFEDEEGFIQDVKRDLKEGLFGKAIIHPKQISLSNSVYRVSKQAYDEAKEILASKKAVFTQNSKMAETSTMQRHSFEILERFWVYGLHEEQR